MLRSVKNSFLVNITYLDFKSVNKLYKINKRSMLSSVKNSTDAMILARKTFINFCEHFGKLQYPNLQNDPKVINFFVEMINKEDYLCNRAFQLALDVTYAKRGFDRTHVLAKFNTYCKINNNGLSENSSIDQSTLFTLLQTTIMKKIYPSTEFTVNETPSPNVNIKDVSEKVCKTLEENLKLTGNRFPDVLVNDIPYDYKFVKDPSSTKNQIYLMPELPEAFDRFSTYLENLLKIYNANSNIPSGFKQHMLSQIQKTQELYKHAITTGVKKEIIQDWNNFIMNKTISRPHNVGIAIFAVGEDSLEFSPENIVDTENVPLVDGRLDQSKAKIVLKELIDQYPESVKEKIYAATKGALGHVMADNTTLICDKE